MRLGILRESTLCDMLQEESTFRRFHNLPQTAPRVGKEACRSLNQCVKIIIRSFPLFSSHFLSSFSLPPFHFSILHCPSSFFPFQEGKICQELDGINLNIKLSVYRIIENQVLIRQLLCANMFISKLQLETQCVRLCSTQCYQSDKGLIRAWCS